MLGPGEWLLTVPMAGASPRHISVRDLPRFLREPSGARSGPGICPVRIPQGFGPAILHFRDDSGSVIYCAEDQISSHCANVLAVVLKQAGMLAPISGAAYTSVTFSRISHAELPEELRPAAAAAPIGHPARLLIFACEDLLGPRLADALGRLCTTQARYLPAAASLTPPRVLQPVPAPRNLTDEAPGNEEASG
jgi:hypothetical protein